MELVQILENRLKVVIKSWRSGLNYIIWYSQKECFIIIIEVDIKLIRLETLDITKLRAGEDKGNIYLFI